MIRPEDIYGGSRHISLTGNLTLKKSAPKVIHLSSAGAYNITLPTVGVPPGKIHHLVNTSANTLGVYFGTNHVLDVPGNNVGIVFLVQACGTDSPVWYGYVKPYTAAPRDVYTSAATTPCGDTVTVPGGGGGDGGGGGTEACTDLFSSLDALAATYGDTLTPIKAGSCCIGPSFGIGSFPAKGGSGTFTHNGNTFTYTVVSLPGAAGSGDPEAPGGGFSCADMTSVLLVLEPVL